ncbi:hypothetical protein LTR36_006012 [Oleoguttula mirabilis]|uniref:Methyltransferase type 11 domain-containing protein n=1 Tax=Oleoguttula mirabilis TaxID=1507867 RepID=A0AAV9JCP8_9PEZI|nr:hypothetical protein LTR36_006012 [Oleoguttula mirabilis]
MAGLIQTRYIAAVLVMAIAAFLAAIANSGSDNPTVVEYYTSLESRLGYGLFLGNRVMEEKLYMRLGLESGSTVMDAGAGSGLVAAFMAERGLKVGAVDLTPMHVKDAKCIIKTRGLEGQVSVKLGDYHDLVDFEDGSLDGVYTMETFVHADDPLQVLRNFMHILKPGGVLVVHEADWRSDSTTLQENTMKEGSYEEMLRHTGFADIDVDDMTDNVLPLWRLFGVVGAVPYEVVKTLRLQHRFTNMMAGVEAYRHWGQGRYISVRAVKPH